MSQTIAITEKDIFHQLRLSCQIPEVAEKIIKRKVILSAAEEAEIEVTKEELQKTANQMRAINKLEDARSTWIWLEKYGLSLANFEEIVYLTIISNKLIDYLFADKVESYFYEHQLDYTGAAMYEIILDDEDEAIELYYEIQEGDLSFHEAAQQYIQSTELRRKGGYKGKVNRAEMKPEISSEVFGADSPTILKPIVTADGIHLILVEEIIKPELNQKLHQEILLNLFSQWLDQQVKQVQVASHFEVINKAA